MDFSRMIGKPFHLQTFAWTASQAAQTTPFVLPFPSAVFSLNKLAASPFELASLYHVKACLLIQIAGTPMHSGCLLASIVPRFSVLNDNLPGSVNQYQAAPHSFLYANSSSAVSRNSLVFYF
jgi:hypothetical protein